MRIKPVTISGVDFKEVWHPFNDPSGFWVEGAVTNTQTGELEPVLYRHFFRLDEIKGPLNPIQKSIPRQVLSIAEGIPNFKVEHVALASLDVNAFQRLHRQNPMLLALLARSVSKDTLWTPADWAKAMRLPWGAIAERIGCHRSVGALAAKVKDCELTGYGYMQLFLTIVRNPRIARLLRHVSRITLDVMTTALSLDAEACLCPALLHAAAQNNSFLPSIAESAAAIIQLRERMGLKPAWPYRHVPDAATFTYWRARIEEAAMRAGVPVYTAYPPPSLAPDSTWAAIVTSDELAEFGDRWGNCAISLHWRLLAGLTAVYHHRHFNCEALCVVVDKEPTGWRVSHVLMPANYEPTEDIRRVVVADFEDALNRQ